MPAIYTEKKTLIRLSGLPSCGKSTLGDLLNESGVPYVDIDRKRRERYGHTPVLPPDEEAAQMAEAYNLMYQEAEYHLSTRDFVAIGATFRSLFSRAVAEQFAQQKGANLLRVALVFPETESGERIIRQRLEQRKNSGSDSNIVSYEEYLRVKKSAVPYDDGQTLILDALRPPTELLQRVLQSLPS